MISEVKKTNYSASETIDKNSIKKKSEMTSTEKMTKTYDIKEESVDKLKSTHRIQRSALKQRPHQKKDQEVYTVSKRAASSSFTRRISSKLDHERAESRPATREKVLLKNKQESINDFIEKVHVRYESAIGVPEFKNKINIRVKRATTAVEGLKKREKLESTNFRPKSFMERKDNGAIMIRDENFVDQNRLDARDKSNMSLKLHRQDDSRDKKKDMKKHVELEEKKSSPRVRMKGFFLQSSKAKIK